MQRSVSAKRRSKAVIYADLAIAAEKKKDFDQAANHGHAALDVTLSQEAVLGADKLRLLRQAIKPNLSIPVLANLHERLEIL